MVSVHEIGGHCLIALLIEDKKELKMSASSV